MGSAVRRILLINDHFAFFGGADTAFRLKRAILEEAGYVIYTFSLHDCKPMHKKNNYVYVESKRRVVRKLGKYLYHPGVYFSLRKVLKETNPHLIFVDLMTKYPLSIYPAVVGYPTIQTLHGPSFFCATGWGCQRVNSSECELGVGFKCFSRGCVPLLKLPLLYIQDRRVSFWAKRAINLFLCPSRHIYESAVSFGFTPARFVPFGIDKYFTKILISHHNGTPTILYVGNVAEKKGVHVLFEAFKAVRDKIPGTRLLIAGRGALIPFLHDQVSKLGLLKDIYFLGFLERHQLLHYLEQAHVLAVPSIWKEQFGLIGIEALACGIPCVGSKIGGIPEWLHDNEWGFLVPPRDHRALAEKLCVILKDHQLRIAFGKKGREFVLKEYGEEKYKNSLLKIVEEYARPDF